MESADSFLSIFFGEVEIRVGFKWSVGLGWKPEQFLKFIVELSELKILTRHKMRCASSFWCEWEDEEVNG